MTELTLPQIGGSHTLDQLEDIARRQAAAGLPPHADLDAAAKAQAEKPESQQPSAPPSPMAPAALPPVTDPGLVTLDGEE